MSAFLCMYNISEFFYVVIMRGVVEGAAAAAVGRVIAVGPVIAAAAAFERARSTSLG